MFTVVVDITYFTRVINGNILRQLFHKYWNVILKYAKLHYLYHITYVTLDHKTSHKAQFLNLYLNIIWKLNK